jgi:hypothetical protein
VLWRLERMGIDVGHRWEELADQAASRIGEAGHPLLVPHLMMALEATGRHAEGDRFLAGLRTLAAEPGRWYATEIGDVILPVCEATRAHRRGDYGRVVELLAPRREQIRALGGSNAQRDLFKQMLIDAAMEAGRRDIVAEMIAHETATRTVPPAERTGYAAAANWLA